MATLTITNLSSGRTLDRKSMTAVFGGNGSTSVSATSSSATVSTNWTEKTPSSTPAPSAPKPDTSGFDLLHKMHDAAETEFKAILGKFDAVFR